MYAFLMVRDGQLAEEIVQPVKPRAVAARAKPAPPQLPLAPKPAVGVKLFPRDDVDHQRRKQ